MNANHGSGPGEITPDGCSVEFYDLLPVMGEPSIVHAAVPEGASILELGCGAGRILRGLAELGHPVVGVDESPGMLARVPDLPTVRGRMETLELGRVFDAVLLASTMINTDAEQRRAFLETCRRHVAPGGVVIVQQTPPSWFETVEPSEHTHDGIRRVVREVDRDGRLVTVVVDYHVGDRSWTHTFTRHPIAEDELAADLAFAKLRFDRWLTPEDRAWFTARPV
ncbi:methyltransferase [Sphaerisporangium krabiense]|uniref:SAM-dependent methyltransferase n=1 Tax=Sphaerisporangium krabiense TaxID=763782 RepID=A0A7W8Z4I6_9ACTN|nr:class I SAM-dependent methyltransferase [Sphaerisporangium krabiense]MBB5627266.1 SAM-dependent methyltransferase [Sphaerisporangium krabiense]GII64600.1 methyltransferase [Sphaerisporangium krabiense]